MGFIQTGGRYSAGTNVQISNNYEISKTDTDTTYQAGDGISLLNNAFINLSMNFSESEQKIGKWIGGQDLYQRTFKSKITRTDTSETVGNIGAVTIVDMFGVAFYSADGTDASVKLDWWAGSAIDTASNANCCYCWQNGNNLVMSTKGSHFINQYVYVTIVYYK